MRQRGKGHVFANPETLSRLLDLYRAGWRLTQLADEFRCDHTSVLYQVRKHGVWGNREFILPPRKPQQRELVAVSVFVHTAYPEAPQQMKPPNKYEYVIEELSRPGKTYKQYRQEAAARAGADSREALMERLRAEKAERDAKIARGEIVIFEEKREFV